ncbi:MAG: HK97 gp10 family phage protein [Vicinamibacterales bacterium]
MTTTAPTLSLKIDISTLTEALQKLSKAGSKAGLDAAYAQAEIIMTEAKRNTPVDTGALRSSGHVTVDRRTTKRFDVFMKFGGAANAYAVFVHEDLRAHHPVGSAKFLENAINRWRSSGGINNLGKALGAALNGVA